MNESAEAAQLFAWDVEEQAPRAASGGVTDDRRLAFTRVSDALRQAPLGARGQVRRVRLHPYRLAQYEEIGVAARAWRNPDSGQVEWL